MADVNQVEEFRNELAGLYDELSESYEGNGPQVWQKITAARELLAKDGELGEWEAELLKDAEAAVNHNFLRLAVTYIVKAIVVSQLPQVEYEWGFNYGKPQS